MVAPVTSFYAGVLAILFIGLSLRVIRERHRVRAAIGAGGDPMLERAARVQANFAEYTPFALLLLLLAEIAYVPAFGLHLAGIALLVGRGLHAFGVSQPREDLRLRLVGMCLTFAVIIGLALILLATGMGG
ncbi:MAPEG family protein [Methylocella sp.]|uniref:MAPEG family protein n=1 Tax=Methylocella sp. TaxID=1978226 RepID=UPI003783DDF7